MKYNLFIDDERFPNNEFEIYSAYKLTGDRRYITEEWVIVRDFGEFVKTIEENGVPQMISFDHDLKDDHYYHYRTFTLLTGYIDYTVVEGTGQECAKWLTNYLLENDLECPTILIHTQNTVGAKNIYGVFQSFNKARGI